MSTKDSIVKGRHIIVKSKNKMFVLFKGEGKGEKDWETGGSRHKKGKIGMTRGWGFLVPNSPNPHLIMPLIENER